MDIVPLKELAKAPAKQIRNPPLRARLAPRLARGDRPLEYTIAASETSMMTKRIPATTPVLKTGRSFLEVMSSNNSENSDLFRIVCGATDLIKFLLNVHIIGQFQEVVPQLFGPPGATERVPPCSMLLALCSLLITSEH
jgi:hypothetical protein